jgi:thymidylate synthase (FAD)
MRVELLTSPASVGEMERNTALAALTCHANAEKEHVASEVLGRIIKSGHESVLEHITLTYSVKGISRALLQELARHRHMSLSVESTRHTLRKSIKPEKLEELSRGNDVMLSFACFFTAFALRHPDMPNDDLKYYLPEFWPTNLVLTVNIRELRHILRLRTAPAALKEFRDLARAMYDAVAEEYRYLLKDCVNEEASDE